METYELSLNAAQLRGSLELCQSVTQDATQLLDRCSAHLRELDRVAQPLTQRTVALTRARENVKKAMERAAEVLDHLDASRKVESVIGEGPRANLQAFLAALAKLDAAIQFLQQHRHMQTAADALGHTTALRGRAVEQCGAEFGALLAKHSAVPQALLALQRQSMSLALSSRDLDQEVAAVIPDMLPETVLPKLRALAQAQLSNGDRSCLKTFVDTRRRVVQQCLEGLLAGIGSREDIARMAWRQVEVRIPSWVAAVKLLVRLVQEEARLCALVFPSSEQFEALQQVTSGPGRFLIEAGDRILSCKPVPDKLFGLLDMHEAASAALPSLRAALLAAQQTCRLERASPGMGGMPAPAPQTLAVYTELAGLLTRTVAEVRACFALLQESYGGKVADSVPPDGTVHPLCGSTVAALKRLMSYESALPVLFGEGAQQGPPAPSGMGGLREEARLLERMSAAVTTILDSLLAAVGAKAQAAYRTKALAALHMLNNAQFLSHAAAGKELRAVAEPWLDGHKGLVEQYQRQYMEACWAPLVSLLQADLRQPAPGAGQQLEKGGRQAAKDKWTAVNKLLEPVMAQQGSWTVVDPGLRYGLKDSIADLVLPPYQEFTERYMRLPFTENRTKYMKVGVGALRGFLAQELFERGGEGGGSAVDGRSGSRTADGSSHGGMTRSSVSSVLRS
ncbi:hypothetical protein N2152v2_011119 [Parachlorella kessleri]